MAKCLGYIIVCMTFLLMMSRSAAQVCPYAETVDLRYATRFENGSYLHEGIVIPADLVTMYDYMQDDNGKVVQVAAHARGCICGLKPCINICCPQGFGLDVKSGECASLRHKTENWSNTEIDKLHINGNFFTKTFKPCHHMTLLQPQIYGFDQWKLLENGTLLRLGEVHNLLETNEFCLTMTESHEVLAAECIKKEEEESNQIFNDLQSLSLTVDDHISDGIHVPCSFFDTVNVTGGERFANGSYLYEGIVIPSFLIGIYDYVYVDLTTRENVEPHLRGCVCKIRPCISFCCPWGTKYNTNTSECDYESEAQWPNAVLNITMDDDTVQPISIFNFFAIQTFRPCEIMYPLQPAIEPEDEYQLFENGSMLRVQDNEYMNKNEYCLVPTLDSEYDVVYTINPANCAKASEYTVLKKITAMAMLFSIPFMVLTIAVYLSIHELRNQHGKSLVCYLLGLIVGYSCLSSISLLSELTPTSLSCKALGYTAYYSFLVAFFWLSVISFDLWHNFRCTHRSQKNKRFIVYSLYGWGLPLIFLVFTFYAQEYTDIPEDLKPGIGGGLYCWLDMHTWSALIYFFGPVLIIIFTNVIMFIMTSIKIHKVQQEMARIMAKEDSTKNLRNEKDRFGLFLRLFIVMGVTWSLEIVSYFVGPDQFWTRVFYIPDLCNAIQGFLIFMLFVMKRKVKHLIVKRYSYKRKPESQNKYSSKITTTSTVNLSLTCNTPPAEKPLMDKRIVKETFY